MRPEHLKLLRCPKTKSPLVLKNAESDEKGRIRNGTLVCLSNSTLEYPIRDYIPRFVPAENYAENFGFQWKRHHSTQHDYRSGLAASEIRFWKETGWSRNLKGELVLEAGCGSGRFTKFPLEAGATVISFDYSRAVEVNAEHNGGHGNLLLLQADMFNPPFETKTFDKVFCFGVLQHTPDPEKAFQSLTRLLKPGGKIATDIYLRSLLNYHLNPVYYVRRFTRKQDPERLYRSVTKYVDLMWPIVRTIRRIPKVGSQINRRLLMVADHSTQFPEADDQTLKEWAYLDTYDWLSPMYDIPQTPRTFFEWHKKAGLTNIDVGRGYNGVEGRGTLGN